MSTKLIKNIGTLISGDINNPIIKADAIFIEDGKISARGSFWDFADKSVDQVIDAQTTVTPGLIDSHCHVVLGDFSPRQNQIGFLESETHGGVTTMIGWRSSSPGTSQRPGRHEGSGHSCCKGF